MGDECRHMHDMLDANMLPVHIPPMTLNDYLDETKETDTAFAVRVGLSQSQVGRLRRNVSKPSWDAIVAIETATEGKVQPNDWPRQEAVA